MQEEPVGPSGPSSTLRDILCHQRTPPVALRLAQAASQSKRYSTYSWVCKWFDNVNLCEILASLFLLLIPYLLVLAALNLPFNQMKL